MQSSLASYVLKESVACTITFLALVFPSPEACSSSIRVHTSCLSFSGSRVAFAASCGSLNDVRVTNTEVKSQPTHFENGINNGMRWVEFVLADWMHW